MHLLGRDVVVEQRLAVLQRRSVGKAADEVGVGMGVARAGGQMARHVVGRCGDRRQTGDKARSRKRCKKIPEEKTSSGPTGQSEGLTELI